MEIKEVFEPVLNFIRNLQKKDKEPASKQAAKDRLKLVLMQDRASVSPDFFEMMKKEIIDVIKKYIEIDEEALEVELTRGIEAGLEGPALYANIPIKNVKPVAPKSSDDEDGTLESGVVKSEESASGKEVKPLSEEEASKVADDILNNIENVASVEETADEIRETENVDDSNSSSDSSNSEEELDGTNVETALDSEEIEKASKGIEEKSSKADCDDDSKNIKKKTVRKTTGTKKKTTRTTTKKKTEK